MTFAWLSTFRRRDTASDVLSTGDILGYSMPSLFVFGQVFFPFNYLEDPQSYPEVFGSIEDIGFADNWLQPLAHAPERTREFPSGSMCTDRFLRVGHGNCGRSLARIDVNEWRVHDDYMRSDIDYTGFRVCVTFREDAYRLFQNHLMSIEPESELDRHSRRFAVRIPSRPFTFPPPRGSVDPWDTRQNVVGRLKPIQRFRADSIAITMLTRQPLTAVPSAGSLHDRYRPWLRTTLLIHSR